MPMSQRQPQGSTAPGVIKQLKHGKRDQSAIHQAIRQAPRPVARQAATKGNELVSCARLEDWLEPTCEHYRGLCVPRRQSWGDIQLHVDALATSGLLGREQWSQAFVDLRTERSEQALASEVSYRARQIIRRVSDFFPDVFMNQIQDDFEQVGMVVAKMFPTADKIIMKLEIQGESVCARWHQDNYVGRAIVSYNGDEGTLHVHNDNVNFDELEHGGINEHIVRDQSQVFSVDVGDVLFIKGNRFPNDVNGLVHKAPLKRYHPDGSVKNRLCMKVDVSFLRAGSE